MVHSPTLKQWIELSKKYGGPVGQPRVLPIVKRKGKHYFVDERCRQLRNVEDPCEWIDFETKGDLQSFMLNECQIIT